MISKSPLRYPGGKARFTPFIWSAIQYSNVNPDIFAEPFCGGAGVSLAMLELGYVKRIALNDIDPLVANFWKVVFGKTESPLDDLVWLIKKIETAILSVDEWRHQKSLQPTSIREAAFKCLYLNRTSFNGILYQSGPIGGWEQKNRKLDSRFNPEKIIRRIYELNQLKESVVQVSCISWKHFCNYMSRKNDVYLYLDPPYYHKANQLYAHTFNENAHRDLRDYLGRVKNPWMLSYDDAPEVRSLYVNNPKFYGLVIDQTYSTHPLGGNRFVGRELFFSNRELPVKSRIGQHSGMSVVGSLPSVPMSSGPVRIPFLDGIAE